MRVCVAFPTHNSAVAAPRSFAFASGSAHFGISPLQGTPQPASDSSTSLDAAVLVIVQVGVARLHGAVTGRARGAHEQPRVRARRHHGRTRRAGVYICTVPGHGR